MPVRACHLVINRAYFNSEGTIFICTKIKIVLLFEQGEKGESKAHFVVFNHGSLKFPTMVSLGFSEINRSNWRRIPDEKVVEMLGATLNIFAIAKSKQPEGASPPIEIGVK